MREKVKHYAGQATRLSSCPWHLSACICPDLCLILSAASGGEGLFANTHTDTGSSSSHPHVTSHSLQFPSSQPSCMPQSTRHKSAHLPPPLRISPPTAPSSLCTTTAPTPSALPISPSPLVLMEVQGSTAALQSDTGVKRTVSFWKRRMWGLGCCLPPKPWCSSWSTHLWARWLTGT